MAATEYYAHSPGDGADGMWHRLEDHLQATAQRAAEFAEAFGSGEWGRLAGWLHDVGKYGEKFQDRLHGLEHGIDHWSAGAWIALCRCHAIAVAQAVQGHHVGLQRGDRGGLADLDPRRLVQGHPLGLRLSDPDVDRLYGRFVSEVRPALPPPPAQVTLENTAGAMLDVRMLFSALVDADFLDTEEYFFKAGKRPRRERRPEGLFIDAAKALAILLNHVQAVRRKSRGDEKVNGLRDDLLAVCLDAAAQVPGLFTLSAPTGAGKTLAMLAFALKHAALNNLRRVVVVVPYLSIIDQTVSQYAAALGPHFEGNYLLEHHSLAGTRAEGCKGEGRDEDHENVGRRTARLLSENWDAPLVVTTSVQFLESLFANRPAPCRKLHRLARSVVLFDEVQTLPLHLAVPTLATLSHLASRYGTSVVFATATQPAFAHLDRHVEDLGGRGWRPREIVTPQGKFFGRIQRTKVHWPDLERPTNWTDLARRLSDNEHRQVLCIVNLRRHAQDLAIHLRESLAAGVLHLSTTMCPAHRKQVLDRVHTALDGGAPCRLISTQCVEAGVDVDFPVVYRAWGPLEAIAQAAGRCNRNRRLPVGHVHVFLPDEPDERSAYPPGGYAQAAAVARLLLSERGPTKMNLENPDLFKTYYRRLYDLARPHERRKGLTDAIRNQDFVEVARRYRIIEQDVVNVVVPYDDVAYADLAAQVRKTGLTAAWVHRARPHAVSVFRRQRDSALGDSLEPVPLGRREFSDEWFICLNPDDYNKELLGFVPSEWPTGYYVS